jgi:anti-sigma factor ChrR (cupin superfamily)
VELAAIYAAGALAPHEAAEFEHSMAKLEPADRDMAASLVDTAAALAYAAPVAEPPKGLRDRVMAAIQPSQTEPLPGVHVKRGGDSGWKSTPYPGVTYKMLHFDKQTSMATSLLKLEAGAVYPSHRHRAAEQCLVIEGEAQIGSVTIRTGDFERADADTVHGMIETKTGCVLLIIASTQDEMLV